ncbi:hypothetical protein FRC06_008958 [Ceratobasidium sp. 370]|nr:hypothetical protein FRC06_008958 [Ceratobasidium sp. 370]
MAMHLAAFSLGVRHRRARSLPGGIPSATADNLASTLLALDLVHIRDRRAVPASKRLVIVGIRANASAARVERSWTARLEGWGPHDEERGLLVKPGGHWEQLFPFEYVLRGHAEHEFAEGEGTEPPGHGVQLLEPGLEMLPGGQSVQDVSPAEL